MQVNYVCSKIANMSYLSCVKKPSCPSFGVKMPQNVLLSDGYQDEIRANYVTLENNARVNQIKAESVLLKNNSRALNINADYVTVSGNAFANNVNSSKSITIRTAGAVNNAYSPMIDCETPKDGLVGFLRGNDVNVGGYSQVEKVISKNFNLKNRAKVDDVTSTFAKLSNFSKVEKLFVQDASIRENSKVDFVKASYIGVSGSAKINKINLVGETPMVRLVNSPKIKEIKSEKNKGTIYLYMDEGGAYPDLSNTRIENTDIVKIDDLILTPKYGHKETSDICAYEALF